MEQRTSPFWNLSAAQVLGRLKTTQEGLSTAEAASRLKRYAARRLAPKKRTDTFTLLLGQFRAPSCSCSLLPP
jgi:Mg2+-importing ATPase